MICEDVLSPVEDVKTNRVNRCEQTEDTENECEVTDLHKKETEDPGEG